MAHAQKIKNFLFTGLLLVLCPSLSLAQIVPVDGMPVVQNMVVVTGNAQEQVAADRVIVSIALVSKNKTLEAAKEENNAQLDKLLKVASDNWVPKDKVSTSNIYTAPDYRYEQASGEQKFVGYTISRSIRVTVDKIANSEKFLSGLIDAKIDQVSGVEYSLANPQAFADQLRRKAFDNAKIKAESYAAASGKSLGKVLKISTVADAISAPMPMMARAMGASAELAAAPVLPGMVSLSEAVEVQFALE